MSDFMSTNEELQQKTKKHKRLNRLMKDKLKEIEIAESKTLYGMRKKLALEIQNIFDVIMIYIKERLGILRFGKRKTR